MIIIPKKSKVTSSFKHDNLWIRVTLNKGNYVRLSVLRGGWKITGNGDMRSLALSIKSQFEELLDADYNYGDAMDYMIDELTA